MNFFTPGFGAVNKDLSPLPYEKDAVPPVSWTTDDLKQLPPSTKVPKKEKSTTPCKK